MKICFIGLLSTVGVVLSAPVVTRSDSSSRFPIPSIGESVSDYSTKLLSYFGNLFINDYDTLDTVAKYGPHFSLNSNMKFLEVIEHPDLPSYNTYFDHIDVIDDERVKWLTRTGDRNENDPVILYLHGGGYIFGMFPPYINLWIDLWKDHPRRDRLSVLLFNYDLAPNDGTYPKALQQLAIVYNQLLKSSKNIILAGDGAGGNLALALLRHIKYPVDTVTTVTTKPQGLLLFSPMVSIDPPEPSVLNGTWLSNNGKDLLSANSVRAMAEIAFPNDADRSSVVNNPWKDYIDWESLLPDDKNKIYISYSTNEVLKDDIVTWATIAKFPNSPKSVLGFFESTETHDSLVFMGKSSEIYGPFSAWLNANIASLE